MRKYLFLRDSSAQIPDRKDDSLELASRLQVDQLPDEEVMLAKACAGDEDALATLFHLHSDRLQKMIRIRLDRRIQGRVDPGDILQETFLAVQNKFAQYCQSRKYPFFVWLRMEAKQKLTDIHRFHLGSKMRDARTEVTLFEDDLLSVNSITLAEHLLGRLTTASQAAMRTELQICVQETLEEMTPMDREVLVLRHFEELTNSEAAHVLGLSESTTCHRYYSAIQRLRDAFEQFPGGLEGFLT